MKRTASIALVMSWFFFMFNSSLQRPNVSLIEKRISERVNKERAERNIALLKLSPVLSSLARRHSRDMATRLDLSHLSSSGKTYLERLVADKFYFGEIGENVARSETFLYEVIHQKLMESPKHRENILDPDFDEIGVGVVYKKGVGYFMTQDFLQSVKIEEAEQVAEDIRRQIHGLRTDHSKPSLIFYEVANTFARRVSMKKAKDGTFPPVPESFGEAIIYFYSTPFPTQLVIQDEIKSIILSEEYIEGGLGVWFGRNDGYPGGAYFITMIFYPRSKYMDMSNQDLVRIIAEEINRKRENFGLPQLNIHEKLSEKARNISKLAMAQGNQNVILPPEFQTSFFVSFVTEDLYVWPPRLDEVIKQTRVKNIGVGIIPGQVPGIQKTSFWVTVVFK